MDSTFVYKIINTVILVAIFYKLLKKPITNWLTGGVEGVVSKFETARKEKEDVLELLKEAEKKVKEAKQEAEGILKHAEEVAAKQKEQMLAEAREIAERVRASANEEIEREVIKAKKALQTYAAEKAVELAEEKLKGKIDEEFNKELIKTSLSQIAKEGVL